MDNPLIAGICISATIIGGLYIYKQIEAQSSAYTLNIKKTGDV